MYYYTRARHSVLLFVVTPLRFPVVNSINECNDGDDDDADDDEDDDIVIVNESRSLHIIKCRQFLKLISHFHRKAEIAFCR